MTTPTPARLPHALRAAAALGLVAIATIVSGCVGYNVYPAAPGERGFTNVNDDPIPQLETEALRWAVTRYPPNAATEFSPAAPAGPGQTPFAVNLPPGTSGEIGRKVIQRIGYNAQPMVPGNEKLPTYSVARVWVSGDDAKVDIVRPVLGLTGPGAPGKDATQGITIRLRGGLKPWTVTSHRVWSFNSMAVPAISYLPALRTDESSPGAPIVVPSDSK